MKCTFSWFIYDRQILKYSSPKHVYYLSKDLWAFYFVNVMEVLRYKKKYLLKKDVISKYDFCYYCKWSNEVNLHKIRTNAGRNNPRFQGQLHNSQWELKSPTYNYKAFHLVFNFPGGILEARFWWSGNAKHLQHQTMDNVRALATLFWKFV